MTARDRLRQGNPAAQPLRVVTKSSPSRASGSATDERRIQVIQPPNRLEDLYEFCDKIYDAGDRSKIFGAKCRKSGKDVAIKMRGKRFFGTHEHSMVWRSVLTRMLNLETNSHVLGLNCVLEDADAYYIVMEKCEGGELFDFLLNETDVPERECKRIMREILLAVDHIHTQGLIHRDIKPENIMFAEDHRDGSPKTVKLIDFDTCQEYVPSSPSRTTRIVGTPGYIAPESFKGEYTPASDLWSVGVIFYILMTGDTPFPEDVFCDDIDKSNYVGTMKMDMIYRKLETVKIDFDCCPWPDFPQARDLCMSLLSFNPGDRSPSAREALKHPWFVGEPRRGSPRGAEPAGGPDGG